MPSKQEMLEVIYRTMRPPEVNEYGEINVWDEERWDYYIMRELKIWDVLEWIRRKGTHDDFEKILIKRDTFRRSIQNQGIECISFIFSLIEQWK